VDDLIIVENNILAIKFLKLS